MKRNDDNCMVHIETEIKNIDRTINELEAKIESEPDPVFHEMLNRFIRLKEKYQKLQRKYSVYKQDPY